VQQAGAFGQGGGLHPAGGAELAQDVADVHPGRLTADAWLGADLRAAAPGGQQPQHRQLPAGQPVGGHGLRRRRDGGGDGLLGLQGPPERGLARHHVGDPERVPGSRTPISPKPGSVPDLTCHQAEAESDSTFFSDGTSPPVHASSNVPSRPSIRLRPA
jgi:hypothetical protein